MKLRNRKTKTTRRAVFEALEGRRLLSAAVDTPFTGAAFAPNQVIPAVQYDKGGEGVSYHDTTAKNLGNSTYRAPDAVDIETGGSTGKVIGYAAAGEWLNYTVKIPTASKYALQVSAANVEAGGSLHVGIGSSNLTGSIAIPISSGWQTYHTATSAAFSLAAGTQVLRITLDHAAANTAVANLDWFKLVSQSTTTTITPPPPSTGLTSPLVWKTLASAPIALAEAQSVSVNGKLYAFGGYNVSSPDYQATSASEVFNPATNTWTRLAPMPVAETHMGVATDGTYIYIAGGYTYNPKTTFQTFGTTNVWRYNIAANTWSAFTPLPAARAAGALVVLNNQLHFFDGVSTSRIGQTEHWVLTLGAAKPTWTNAASLPFSRNHMTAVVLNGKIYAIGGQSTDDDSSTTANVLVWDPAHPSAWTAVASMPSPRSHAVTAIADGKIVVAGGTLGNDVPISSVIVYDPATNKWTTQTSLPSARLAAVGGVVGNLLIVTTGVGGGNLQMTTWAATI